MRVDEIHLRDRPGPRPLLIHLEQAEPVMRQRRPRKTDERQGGDG